MMEVHTTTSKNHPDNTSQSGVKTLLNLAASDLFRVSFTQPFANSSVFTLTLIMNKIMTHAKKVKPFLSEQFQK